MLGLTLWSEKYDDFQLRQIAEEITTEVEKVKDVAITKEIGGRTRELKVVLDKDCPEDRKLITKVDDGYTDKQNILLDINLEREQLLEKQLAALGRGPLSIGVNSTIKNEFQINRGDKVAKTNIEGREVEVVINQDNNNAKTS